jgi:rRNA processing protein Gar1
MKTVQKKPVEELRMSSAEFDRIMGQALQVKPEEVKKSKRPKPKAKNKKSRKK